jgi:hypothetical protein
MYDRKISGRPGRALDAWHCNAAASGLFQEKIGGMDCSARWRQRIQEPNGDTELVHLITKLPAVRTVPRDD